MFLSLIVSSLAILFAGPTVSAKDVHFDWNITWTTANPDGLQARPVIGINNQWPLPVINITKGDRIIAKVTNQLGNQSTTIHWHGMYQNGTNFMDGPAMVTQCNIPTGASITYNFTADQVGTYWYHSHTRAQYPDGLRQALIIQDPKNPYAGEYDEERVITLSDWYHDEMPDLMKQFVSYKNPTGAEPVPNSALMNDTQNMTLPVEPGKTYLLRLVNVGAFASQYFWIEGHTMKIVEVDGVWTKPAETDMIYIASAQRYAVLVTMKNETGANYPMMASMDTSLFDSIPDGLNWNVTGWLEYDSDKKLPPAAVLNEFEPYDDFKLVPTDGEKLLEKADHTITLDLTMNNLGDGANYAFFNDISYVSPKVPTLYTVLSTGENATNPTVYGTDTNSFVLKHGEIVEIVLNNDDSGRHPFHLHGQTFQVVHRSEENAGHYNASWTNITYPSVPMRRDTFLVYPQGNFVIRFPATNPGVWLFHCHIEWHMDTGLIATMISSPLQMQKTLTIPEGHKKICADQGISTVGNAAGNTEDYLDLTGQNMMVPPLPSGFTTKGYVAMVFSCVAGVLGLASITLYGSAPIAAK
ncbi:hypothetical protein FOPG_10736 [Fusarium oxysporum f. sp. conglutinans race 2 54008]|uniref:Iron transport multicopper oxidase FET3 n=4 Tax=Fusarium oxysporum f. sp. conglutinans TaxID=100902 RepID=A0A8H6GLM3_FUSOX|nr:hypothetical protein FOXB_13812 [Fusarium oxysporum f. sp. conglutinans Fo5176]EXL74048.1 hypothetical protein FOPG_10736 [Fusarium oxysporum f. sp. conglutinans race 2 54008]KAF6520709.1 hypothetical protein HZS61_014967 [Fusarium oxysporum f. sp. conglutinans]KAG6994606.1 Iron transport multicopper oxidase fetC [Fusarium oxysporum f. sp. conglutinans]KAI8408914.1 hypothetical protein FOFC_11864 [Fusarium oxysporum]